MHGSVVRPIKANAFELVFGVQICFIPKTSFTFTNALKKYFDSQLPFL